MRRSGWIVLWAVSVAIAAPRPDFAGRWETTRDGRVLDLTLTQDGDRLTGTLRIDKLEIPVAGVVDRAGQLDGTLALADPGDKQPIEHRHFERFSGYLDGGRLSLTIQFADGPTTITFDRPGHAGASPVAPFLGDWEATGNGGAPLRMSIAGDGPTRVRGNLTIDGQTAAFTAEHDAAAGRLRGVLQVAQADGPPREFEHFVYLTAEPGAGGLRISLKLRQGTAELAFRRPGASTTPAPGADPVRLGDVYDGPTKPYAHPDGYFTTVLPDGWSVAGSSAEAVLINPGLAPGQAPDGLALLTWGRLEAADQSLSPTALLERRSDDLKRMLAGQGIAITGLRGAPALVQTDDVPGAVIEWTGTAGGRPIVVWLGVVVKRDWYLGIVTLMAEGQEARFLPGSKRIFLAFRPRPPERNQALEAALVGRSFSSSSMHAGGGLYTWYEFGPGGRVSRTISLNGGDVGGSSESAGRYEVIGRQAYLYFDSGQEVATILSDEGRVTGLRIGTQVYGG